MDAWTAVKGHIIFENIHEKHPCPIGSGGTQTPFNQHDLDTILMATPDDNQVTYVCGGNLAWIDFTWTATPGVPVRMRAMKELANTLFAKPRPIESVTIALPSRGYKPMEHCGAFIACRRPRKSRQPSSLPSSGTWAARKARSS